ncbi:MAG: glycoside hydrolase family 38 C-terminal domain-containing protein [Candidatus Melainabacteria bacterium]|nr:glycoside hydrolase family 38 C-terminal domain-containing protein [Candidatus Melainabacteria bacterium]
MVHVFAMHHTHWDREWYEPFATYQVRLAEVVDAILDRLDSGAFQQFTLDGQTVLLEDYLAFRPQQRARLKAAIESGRLSVGPWYVMPDEFLVCGESLIRNLQRGLAETRHWTRQAQPRVTGYLPDTFGHSDGIPMLLRQFDIDSAMVWRGVRPAGAPPVFWWKSPDGSGVRVYHLREGYFQMHLHDSTLTDPQRVEALQAFVGRLAQEPVASSILLPVGGDHLGPISEPMVQLLCETFENQTQTTAADFMHWLAEHAPPEALSQWYGELCDHGQGAPYLLTGTFSARMYLKQWNRTLEHRLIREVEPLLLLAHSHCADFPDQAPVLAQAWQQLLLNHPHDSICGCSVDAVHRENEQRFERVQALCDALSVRARRTLQHALATPADWLVLHTGDRLYTGVVPACATGATVEAATQGMTQVAGCNTVLKDDYLTDHQQVPLSDRQQVEARGWVWVQNVPSLGWQRVARNTTATAFSEQTGVSPSRVQVSEVAFPTLDNGLLQVTPEADGTLTVWNATTQNVIKGLHQWLCWPEQGDSYNSAPVPGTGSAQAVLESVHLVENGPLVSSLRLQYALPQFEQTVLTTVSLHAGEQLLRFETQWVNRLENQKLQVVFPAETPIDTVLAETHFGTVKRFYSPYRLDSREAFWPVASGEEWLPNSGPIQRFIIADAHLLLSQGLTEYELHENTVSLTLFRGFSAISSAHTGVRGGAAGPPFETPEAQCLGRSCVARYAWAPKPEELHTAFTLADRFYGNSWALPGTATQPAITQQEAALCRWDNAAVVAMATPPYALPTPAEEDDTDPSVAYAGAFRLLNTTGREQSVTLQYTRPVPQPICAPLETSLYLHRTNFAGRVLASDKVAEDGCVTVVLDPYAASTFVFSTCSTVKQL